MSPSSRAAEVGLQRGDVIQEVNHKPVKSVKDFDQAIGSSKNGDPVLLLVTRDGGTMYMAV